ncbi:hypothetical protein OHB01_16480 [Microbispora hainanensis]|uniref:Uncharacterized protein n=1 Tax=Microbispora hainanensis TaxID=568844 RepID=A0ABZ1SH51_9ACTN|nr:MULTISPECIES: hypothetical protein [Microbispora]NJP24283.1 hypothetical protein [Microbispora sp. CL1-1]TQS15079.1 hypothetical protein FLW53_08745 [Microbispora sp. SCL1-1]
MTVLLFFNELSTAVEGPHHRTDEVMAEFVDLLRAIHSWRRDLALVTPTPFKSIELTPGYSVQRWIASSGANQDRWRLIQAIRNRAPFQAVLPEGADADVEYRHGGRLAGGLGAAHLSDGLAVSLSYDTVWNSAWVGLHQKMVAEDDHGEVKLHEDTVKVRHATTHQHALEHKDWVQEIGRDGITSGSAIWEIREDRFPHLTFLPRIEGDLHNLRQDWIQPVFTALLKLERSIADWGTNASALPFWHTKVSQEFEGREQLCHFEDLDGSTRIFEWHARFTPGAGRLHFRLVTEDRTARVAYIGRKLGI